MHDPFIAGEIVAGDQSGVENVVWTESIQRGSSRNVCKSAGLLDIILDNDVTPCFFEERGWDGYRAALPSGSHHWGEPMYVTTALDEVDHIIYLPRVASHLLGDYSSGMKLAVGFLRDDSRLVLHQGGEHFYAMYEEISCVDEIDSKLRLIVTSGRRIMTTIGPDTGFISDPDYGLIFASDDLLASELLGYSWLQWNYACKTSTSAKFIEQIIKKQPGASPMVVTILRLYGVRGGTLSTPQIPVYERCDVYCHPAIQNFMKRKGGSPEDIEWQSINQNPDSSVADYLKEWMNIQT